LVHTPCYCQLLIISLIWDHISLNLVKYFVYLN
jgi:hypothetical protein